MRTPLTPNKKGFTLIEIIIVILLLSMLAVAAISSYFNTSNTFNFLSNYKSVMYSMRSARSYAITNKNTGGVERYGVYIGGSSTSEADCVFVFTDDGTDPFKFNDPGKSCKTKSQEDSILSTRTKNFTDTGFKFKFSEEQADFLKFPLYIFYELESGEISAYHGVGNSQIPKTEYKHIDLNFSYRDDEDYSKYLIIFHISGLIEPYNEIV